MAIGTALAIGLGTAALGAGASVIAGDKNASAINKATAAQTAANDQSVGLQRDIYSQNKGILSPFVDRGNAAGSAMNALLGLGGGQATPTPQPVSAEPAMGVLNPAYAPYISEYSSPKTGALRFDAMRGAIGDFGPLYQQQVQPAQAQPQTPAQSPQDAATQAYNIFKQSTGYQDRLQEGYRALSGNFGARGIGQSGAATKAGIKYGQNFASNEFGNYMGYLGNQQGVGVSAGSALAGVGQGYANNVSALNSNQAQMVGQSAIARANNTNSVIGGVGGALSNLAGQYAMSSYGQPAAPYKSNLYDPSTQW